MKMSLVIASCLCFALGTACNKGGSGGSGAAECTYKHQNPSFCLAPPAGWQARPESTESYGSMMGFANDKDVFDLKWGGPYPFDDRIKSAKVLPGPTASQKLVDQGELENGGYWKHTTGMNNGKPYHYLSYLVKGKTGGIECGLGTADTAAFDVMLAACKSLKVD